MLNQILLNCFVNHVCGSVMLHCDLFYQVRYIWSAALKMVKRRAVDDCPNRLFLSYLKLWRDEADAKKSKSYHVYSRAYKSLLKYPMPLQSGKEAVVLEYFGEKLCTMIDSKLLEDAQLHAVTPREYLEQTRQVPSSWWEAVEVQTANKSKKKAKADAPSKAKITKKARSRNTSSFAYIPSKQSGPYGILIALYIDLNSKNSKGSMTKQDLQESAQKFTTKSFTIPDRGSYYTAWSSMATLILKNLVQKSGNPARYALTASGIELAKKLEASRSEESVKEKSVVDNSTRSRSFDHPCSSHSHPQESDSLINLTSEYESSAYKNFTREESGSVSIDLTSNISDDGDCGKQTHGSNFNAQATTNAANEKVDIVDLDAATDESFELYPGQFDVLLCVDNREISGPGRKTEMQRKIKELGIPFESRSLPVGDYLWLARSHCGDLCQELVLDYVVERKCISDLAMSICSGRFREQKMRLRRTGLKKILLIEEPKQMAHQRLPDKTLSQAIYNAQATDFLVKYCDDIAATARYLDVMTSCLRKKYQNKVLRSCQFHQYAEEKKFAFIRFSDFCQNTMKMKGLTVGETFTKMLMSIHGMSCQKAAAITNVYGTPCQLRKAYSTLTTEDEKRRLLSKIKIGPQQRNLGIALSSVVFRLFCN